MKSRGSLRRYLPIALLVAAIAGLLSYSMRSRDTATGPKVRVLSYPSFLNSWGPGPEIARAFKAETGVELEFRDAGDGALMSKKVKLSPVDVVVGIDGLSIPEARNDMRWRALAVDASLLESSVPREEGFVAYDWAPVAFVYREGEIDAPKSLSDLADARFKGAIALQDPRTSTPGLQFLLWVLDEMGIDAGFEFLASLKPNIHSVSPTWSTAYGLFSKKQAKLAFSYLTSPMYHKLEEKNDGYRAAIFAEGHPVQAEYAGVPDSCVNCEAGVSFVKFLLGREAQAIVMRRNFMLPVLKGVTSNTEFATLPEVRAREWKSRDKLLADRAALFERWRRLGL